MKQKASSYLLDTSISTEEGTVAEHQVRISPARLTTQLVNLAVPATVVTVRPVITYVTSYGA